MHAVSCTYSAMHAPMHNNNIIAVYVHAIHVGLYTDLQPTRSTI
jgi:hypothetical protein